MKIDVGAAFQHKGEWGSRLTVQFDLADGGHGSYDISTHGKSQGTIRVEIEALRAFHAARMQRHAALDAIRGQKIWNWTVTDCYVDRRGIDAHLHVIAHSKNGEIMEFEAYAPTADLLPDNAAALAALAAKINNRATAQRAANDAAQAAAAAAMAAIGG